MIQALQAVGGRTTLLIASCTMFTPTELSAHLVGAVGSAIDELTGRLVAYRDEISRGVQPD
jgi:hypothetical protein